MMARSLTPNTTGRTGRDMERKARRVYRADGLVLRDEAAQARTEAMACLRERGKSLCVIAAAMRVSIRSVQRRLALPRESHGAH